MFKFNFTENRTFWYKLVIFLSGQWKKKNAKVYHHNILPATWGKCFVPFLFAGVCKMLIFRTGILTQHSVMGLEARGRRDLSGGTETRFHRTELSRAGLFHYDGKLVCHEVVQNGESFFIGTLQLIRTLLLLCCAHALTSREMNTKRTYVKTLKRIRTKKKKNTKKLK